ncbi:MAG: glycosyltransferase family 39 protein [Candidatus Altiarchaeota archaeon]
MLDVITACIIFMIVMLLTASRRASLFSAAAYLFNPVAIMNSTNGLETSVSVLFYALSFYVFLRVKDSTRRGEFFLLGIVGGLMVLARTDSITLLAVYVLYFLVRRNIGVAYVLLAAGATVAPWMVWDYLTFGTLFQSSALSVPYIVHQNFISAQGSTSALVISHSVRNFVNALFYNLLMLDMWGLGLIPLALLAAYALLGSKEARRKALAGLMPVSLLLLGLLLLTIVHYGIRWYGRLWYLAPASAASSIMAGIFFDSLKDRKVLALLATAIVLSCFAAYGLTFWQQGFWPWQLEYYLAGRWAGINLGPDAVIGSVSSGIIGYYSNLSVVSLDGAINNEAYLSIRNGNVFEYLRESNVTHLVDYEVTLFDDYRGYYGVDIRDQVTLVQTVNVENLTFRGSEVGVCRIRYQ